MLHQLAQQNCLTTSAHSAATFYSGQPATTRCPTWLTPPWPFLNKHGSDRATTGRLLLLTSGLPWICRPSRLSYRVASNPGQATGRRPPDHKARQPHTLAQAEQTEICAAVQLPTKSTTPEEKNLLARSNGCLTCRQIAHSHYNYPTCPSTPGCGQHR